METVPKSVSELSNKKKDHPCLASLDKFVILGVQIKIIQRKHAS